MTISLVATPPIALPVPPQQVPVSVADIRAQRVSAEELQRRFVTDGYLHVRGVVGAAELTALDGEIWALIEVARQLTPARRAGLGDDAYEAFVSAYAKQPQHVPGSMLPDVYYAMHRRSGTLMPRAIDHIPHYALTARALLGHPDLLGVVEAMQGSQFITTACPLVLKYPGKGAMMGWHRDALRPKDAPEHIPTFTADLYLDKTTPENAVWIVPGSHRWTPEEALKDCIQRNDNRGFKTEGAVPLLVEAGDLVLHHTWLNHGSDDSDAALRRVIYFQFLPMPFAQRLFNHTYIRHSHRRIALSIAERQGMAYAVGETPYHYRTEVAFADGADPEWRAQPPFRLPMFYYRKET
jgi:hypothetical protein